MRQLLEYHFGSYRLSTATRELYEADKRLQTPPLVLNLIVTLLVNRDRVVPKEELIGTLWPDHSASDSSLAQAVRRARQLLRDTEAASTWIRTSHRVGYRFVGKVDVLQLATAFVAAPAVLAAPVQPREVAGAYRPPMSQHTDQQRAREALARLRLQAPRVLPLFVLSETVELLEAALPATAGEESIDVQLPLAWHLRQRDTHRAMALADACDSVLQSSRRDDAPALRLRLELIRAEVKTLLTGERHAARESGLRVLADAERIGDTVLACDACWLLAIAAQDDGNFSERDSYWTTAIQHAESSGDSERHIASQLQLAIADARRGIRSAEQKWGARVRVWRSHDNPAIVAMSSIFLQFASIARLDYPPAIAGCQLAYEGYKATGQLLAMCQARQYVGVCSINLGDYETAAAWFEPMLEQARALGWPQALEYALYSMGALLQFAHQYADAREILAEALHYAEFRPNSRSFCTVLTQCVEVSLKLGDFDAALAYSNRVLLTAQRLNDNELLHNGYGYMGRSLLRLGRLGEAHEAALAAIEVASSNDTPYWGTDDLMTLAEVHHLGKLPPPPECSADSPCLHYLLLALQRVESRALPPGSKLLAALAAEYAHVGDHANAYRCQGEAVEELLREYADEASKRTIAMKVRHDTERMRAESEFHRQVATANAQRTQVLTDMNVTLDRLGAVGRDITNRLNTVDVLTALGEHVHGLLDTNSLAVYFMDENSSILVPAFGVDQDQTPPLQPVLLDDPLSLTARCAREQREQVVASEAGVQSHLAGTATSRSELYGPLLIGARLIGVATIQSPRVGVYGERERLVFRSLCSYAAIALDNANAYRGLIATLRELKQTQKELIERNAALDQANHEIQELSFRDPLTGLRNRRFLTQQVERDVALCLREWSAKTAASTADARAHVVFFLIDIDHFKAVNDVHGHAAGDAVLAQLAKRLEGVFRQSDLVIRWGGEEFLAVATHAVTESPWAIAERALQAVSSEPFKLPDGTPLSKTCSIGVAALPFLPEEPHALAWHQVVELADRALYMAKQGGRNAWYGLEARDGASLANVTDFLLLGAQQSEAEINRCQLVVRHSNHHAIPGELSAT